jgi:hypothetical protein
MKITEKSEFFFNRAYCFLFIFICTLKYRIDRGKKKRIFRITTRGQPWQQHWLIHKLIQQINGFEDEIYVNTDGILSIHTGTLLPHMVGKNMSKLYVVRGIVL